MSKVYKSSDTELNEKIAVKLLKPEVSADAEAVKRFRKAFKTARQTSHKGICWVYPLIKKDGNYYITMECGPGKLVLGSAGQMVSWPPPLPHPLMGTDKPG